MLTSADDQLEYDQRPQDRRGTEGDDDPVAHLSTARSDPLILPFDLDLAR